MLFDCALVVAVVVLTRLYFQHHLVARISTTLAHSQLMRMWEEVVSLIWYTWNVIYMIHIRVDAHFFWYSSLTLNAADVHSSEHDGIRLLLAVNMSFYVGMLVVSVLDPRRRDWKEMAGHHIITIVLMFVAYIVGFYDVSVFVLFINAFADVFLSSSRIAYDLDHPAQTPLFAVFVAAHLFLRVVIYPFKVWQAFYTSIDQYRSPFDYLPGLCTVPLWLLYLYWTPKIFKVCWRRAVLGARDVDKSVRQKKSTSKINT